MEREGVGYRGQKKKQRGGASKAEGGLRAREGCQYSLFSPLLFPAVSHTENSGSSCKIHKSWAFIKRCSLADQSVWLRATREQKPGEE